MRIAIFTETFLPRTDGVVNTLCRLLEYAHRNNHDVRVYAPDYAPDQYANSRVIGLSGWSPPFYPELKLVRPWTRVDEQLIDFKPDIVHVAAPFSCGIVGLLAAKRLNVPVIASYHTDVAGFAELWGWGILSQPSWWWMRQLHNRASLNLAPSEVTRRDIALHGIHNTAIWGRGVDAELFHPNRYSSEMRLRLTDGDTRRRLVLYAGRLSTEKRIDTLRPLFHSSQNIRLAIVGDGPYRTELERLSAGTPTVFTGYLKGNYLATAYASADVFAFPSANETFGNVVLEAMASGLPVVCVNAGGPTEIVQHGHTGYLAHVDDTQEFVNAVLRLTDDHVLAAKMGINARSAAEHRSWDSVFDKLFEDYSSQIARSEHERS